MKDKFIKMKSEGYYILKSYDDRRNYTMYELTKNINETQRTNFCELNKAGFLAIQKEINFPVKEIEACFLNFIPFAERQKGSEPLKETMTAETGTIEPYIL